MKVVSYEIEMIDVKAADAFIIHMVDEYNSDHIILVDAGEYSDGERIIKHIHKYYEKPVINLAIVTHPDDDHYGGFFYMLEKIKSGAKDKIEIDEFWIHDPTKHISAADVKYKSSDEVVKAIACSVLEYDGVNLLELIDSLEIDRIEPFALTTIHPRYPLIVLGPVKSFYKSLVPYFRVPLKAKYPVEESEEDDTIDIKENGTIFSKTIDAAGDDQSKHNQSSLIFTFLSPDKKKYLFMGDAGDLAFNNIPSEIQQYAKNVRWLKVPHHGSKYNMSNNMINTIHPEVAYISTEKKGNYLSQAVVNGLKKARCKVYSTHLNRSSYLHNKIVPRDGYSNATPL